MWRCPKCRARVDDSFEVCWSCGATPEGVEDPNFLTADETEPIQDPPADAGADPDDSLEDFAGVPLPELAECHMAESVIEAKFIADRLIEQGIPAVSDTHDINSMMGGLQPTLWGYGPKIRVLPKDLPRARAWVESYLTRKEARRDDAE